jgi:hypothetical protein
MPIESKDAFKFVLTIIITASFTFTLTHLSYSKSSILTTHPTYPQPTNYITSHKTYLPLLPDETSIDPILKAPSVSVNAIVKAVSEYDGWKSMEAETNQTANINKYTEDLVGIFAKFVVIPPTLPINKGL